MRDIKFRGKRKDNGEWVYGYYTKSPITDENSGLPMEYGWYFLTGEERHLIIQDGVAFTVIPDTVGQYTGLHDKNGKEIYEGDIIQTYFSFAPGDAGYGVSQKPFVVKWEQVRAGLRAYKPNADRLHLLDIVDFWETQSSLYEVIGNIYDNPELLGVAK